MSNGTVNYLDVFDRTADVDRLPLVMRWIETEPRPFFKQLREERPILVTPGATLLARYDDVTEVLQLPTVFTAALYVPKMANYLMAHDDDALHYREKAIMQSMLNRDDMPFVRQLVGKIAAGLLDQGGGRIELANQYCRMVPATLVQQFFGLDGVDSKELIEWSYWNQYDTFHNQPFQMLSAEMRAEVSAKHEATGKKLGEYMIMLIARRAVAVKADQAKHAVFGLYYLWEAIRRRLSGEKPVEVKDDILTRMLRTSYAKQVNFPIDRLGINAGGLLIGAIETTSQAVAQIVQELYSRPEVLSAAINAARQTDTGLFDGMVWEALRFAPISAYLFRQTATPYTVAKNTDHATTMAAGTYVLPITQSAMFDPHAFERPDDFDPRRNWFHYFHFGFGSHECLGKYVGMVMIPEMVRQLLLRQDVKPDAPIDYKNGPFPEEYRFSYGR